MKHTIIIGSGIVGATTAYLLAKNKESVTIIDAHLPGSATNVGAGIIAPWANQRRNKAWYTLAKNGAAYYQTLLASLAEDQLTETSYEKVGSLQLYEDEKKRDKMYQIVEKKKQAAPEIGTISTLSPDETKQIFPYVGENYSALHIAGAARIDGDRFRKQLIAGAKLHGAKIIDGRAIVQDQHTVQVNGNQLTADHIVLANGVWMKETLQELGIETNFYRQKGQLLHVHFPQIDKLDFPVVHIPSDPYIVPFSDGRIVIGATKEDKEPMETNHTLGAVAELLQKTFTFAPGLADATLLDVKTGFRPYTPSYIPAFGKVPSMESMFFVNGLGSSGLTTGPYIGHLLTEWILEKEPSIDLAPYAMDPYIL